MKKKILGLLVTGISLFLIYIGFNIYQTNNIEIVAFEDMKELAISESSVISNDTRVTGKVDLEKFESLAMNNQVIIGEHLYLIIYKWPSIFRDDEIDFPINSVDRLDTVSQISIVWGDIYSDEGDQRGFSQNSLINHPEQEIIWQKEGGN